MGANCRALLGVGRLSRPSGVTRNAGCAMGSIMQAVWNSMLMSCWAGQCRAPLQSAEGASSEAHRMRSGRGLSSTSCEAVCRPSRHASHVHVHERSRVGPCSGRWALATSIPPAGGLLRPSICHGRL